LYYNRVFGLSLNSSILAYKILVSLILIEYLNYQGAKIRFLQFILLVGIIITFNRTAILALLFFYGIRILSVFLKTFEKFSKHRISLASLFKFIGVLILLIGAFTYLVYNIGTVIEQFTRDKGTIELAGRNLIWSQFFAFIKENFLFGNGSYKLVVPYGDHTAHAHNAYIETLATNGIIIFLLYLFLVIKNIRKDNWLFISVFLIYSLTQYGIFWGISLADIVLYFFMLHKRDDILERENRYKIFEDNELDMFQN